MAKQDCGFKNSHVPETKTVVASKILEPCYQDCDHSLDCVQEVSNLNMATVLSSKTVTLKILEPCS